jgi:hypothetical protein
VIPDSTRKEETRTLYLQLYPEKAKDFYKVGLGGGAPGGS